MRINDILDSGERTILALRELYAGYGYEYYRMSKFEEYDFYAKNKDFLVSDNVLTFTDTNGKLMALKPDVTLSIIKGSEDAPKGVKKVYYSENVYRPSANDSFKEIMQTGLECYGEIGAKEIAEVLTLAVKSLRLVSEDCVLDVSDLGVTDALLEGLGIDRADKKAIIEAIESKNADRLRVLLASCGADSRKVEEAVKLFCLAESVETAIPVLEQAKETFGDIPALEEFLSVLKSMTGKAESSCIRVDLSVLGDGHYYNGIIFKGFLRSIPSPVLSGGRYDNLMRKLKKQASAIGFAVYTDLLDLLEDERPLLSDDYLNVALPKGRLGEKVYKMFAEAGFPCPSLLEESRKLVFENEESKVRYFWVKPSDVTIYVERGVADVGVAGKDILAEYEPDVYELLDLKKGVCRMAVAGKKDFKDNKGRPLRVATKFSNVTRAFYQGKGRDIDIIHLNGSIEIAPILGLSDVIVDIVETGTTLKENNLEVMETVFPISARLIANKSSAKFKKAAVDRLVRRMSEVVEKES